MPTKAVQAPQEEREPLEPAAEPVREANEKPREINGPKGPEPTRYGDWERAGRCIDF
ncbi:MAG TPA: succinate dehydrogenase assembly factor 4 [Gammaproteobacteria bacterium]